MQKSDTYNQNDGLDFILSETDKQGASWGLEPEETIKLRLLTEEILSLTVRLFDNLKYELYLENAKGRFSVHIKAATIVDPDQKEKVLSLSSRGKNKAAGILGKISEVFGSFLTGEAGASPFGGTFESHYGGENPDTLFSLKYYKNHVPEEEKKPEWDGIEKSIIAHLADDVTIGVKSNMVEVVAAIDL